MRYLIILLLFASCSHNVTTPEQTVYANSLTPDSKEITTFHWNSYGDASYQFNSYFEVTGIATNQNQNGVMVTASSTWGDVTLHPDSMRWVTGTITITCADGWEFFANDIDPMRDGLHLEMLPSEIRIWSDNDTVDVIIRSISLQK